MSYEDRICPKRSRLSNFLHLETPLATVCITLFVPVTFCQGLGRFSAGNILWDSYMTYAYGLVANNPHMPYIRLRWLFISKKFHNFAFDRETCLGGVMRFLSQLIFSFQFVVSTKILDYDG